MPQLLVWGENKRKDYELARQKAAELTDIFSAGPVQIRSTFHLHVPSGQLDGTYRYLQLSQEEYREDIETTDFKESTVHRNGDRYLSRSRQFEPLPVLYLQELIRFAHNIPAGIPFATVSINGQNAKCYAVERGYMSEDSDYKACFDTGTGLLVSLEHSLNTTYHRFEYSHFLQSGGKMFPGTMRMFYNDKLLAEVSVESIVAEPIDAKALEPPADALKQADCRQFQPAEADYTTEYFHIRSGYRPGSVTVVGSVDDRGKVQETEVQQSSDQKLDGAALRALKEVHIRPARCDGHPIASSFLLQIWFSPSLHPDFFESFR